MSSLLKLQRKYPKFNYLLLIRNHHIKRLHLRPYLSFLNRQYTLTQLFTNQLSVGGGFLKLYKFIRFNFIQLLRVNLIRPKGVADAYVFKNSDLSLFYSIFTTQHHLYNVDRFLLWRLTHPNSLFGLLFTVKRRKHKWRTVTRLHFVSKSKRLFLAQRWLKNFFKANLTSLKAPTPFLAALEHFFTVTPSNHIFTLIKLEVYRVQLLRLV